MQPLSRWSQDLRCSKINVSSLGSLKWDPILTHWTYEYFGGGSFKTVFIMYIYILYLCVNTVTHIVRLFVGVDQNGKYITKFENRLLMIFDQYFVFRSYMYKKHHQLVNEHSYCDISRWFFANILQHVINLYGSIVLYFFGSSYKCS